MDDRVEYSLTIVVLVLFLVDVLITLVYMDARPFFRDAWCVADLIMTVSFLLLWLFAPQVGRFFVAMRLLRVLRVLVIFYRQQQHVKASVRKFVSQNRRRYVADGFDLDITPITERILVSRSLCPSVFVHAVLSVSLRSLPARCNPCPLSLPSMCCCVACPSVVVPSQCFCCFVFQAMSVPAVRLEALYRNPVKEVARFFNTKHKGHYRESRLRLAAHASSWN